LNPDYYRGFYKLGTIDVDDRKKIETAINEHYKNISQFYYHEYKYDDMVIGSISLFFLNNILVEIYIENPSLHFNLPKSFIEKYDDGIGRKKMDVYSTWNDKCKCYDIHSLFTEEKSDSIRRRGASQSKKRKSEFTNLKILNQLIECENVC